MTGSFLPPEQTTSAKPVDAGDKPKQNDKAAPSGSLLEPFLNQSVSATSDKKNAAQLDKTATDWTIVADMTILFDLSGSHGHMGAEDKTALLKQLTESTRGKSVSIVLEAITADGKDVPGHELSLSKQPYGAQMIVLRDGHEYDIATGKSKGLKGDLQDALDFALTNQPSKKVALAINAHGMGDQGILGGTQENPGRENGRMTAEELTDTIKTSLTGAHRGKLDVVDMDSCLMAEMGVLRSMNNVTSQYVASERTETVFPGGQIDGQNLNSWITSVINKPTMTGSEVAHEIVAQADRHANGFQPHDGAETLTQFDLEHHFNEFNDVINGLGKALNDVSKNGNNEQQIDQAIDMAPNLAAAKQYGPPSSEKAAKVDIKMFMGTLQMKLNTGAISDPEHELSNAVVGVQKYLSDKTKLIASAHLPMETSMANPMKLEQTSAGLSVYLPVRGVRNNNLIPKADVDNLQKMESGTADSDWYEFLGSLRKPIKAFGDLSK